MKNHTLYISVSVLALFAALLVASPDAVKAASCTILSRDLSSGSNDASAGGEVLKLQNFLKDSGYLSATPNGNFGPATQSAVKSFQSASGISTTGTVGPLTRLAIQFRSCSSPTTAPAPATPSQTTSSQSPVSVPSGINAPVTGEHLAIGQQYTISWKREGYGLDVVLEDATGLSQGFITSGIGGTNIYKWRIGDVYSTKTQMNMTVEPGTYRIRVRGIGMSDQVSGAFTIEPAQLTAKGMFPSSITADGASSMVVYGSGFTERTSILVDGNVRLAVSRLYTSSDGKVVVFAIPATVSPGSHTIILNNEYGTSPVTAGIFSVVASSNPY